MNNVNSPAFGCHYCNGSVGKLMGKGANRKQAERQVAKDVGGSIGSTSRYHVKQAESYLVDLQKKPSVLLVRAREASSIDIKA